MIRVMMTKEKKNKTKILNNRKKARDIVKEITSFGVNDDQIFHIIYLLSLNLENIEIMKEVSAFLKKFTENINTENNDDNIVISKANKIILN
jgi:hypothetical protein